MLAGMALKRRWALGSTSQHLQNFSQHAWTLALNFSRPGAQVVGQYYMFLRLGFQGFKAVQQASRDVATWLAGEVERLGPFQLLTRGDQLPVFAFTTARAPRPSMSSTSHGV